MKQTELRERVKLRSHHIYTVRGYTLITMLMDIEFLPDALWSVQDDWDGSGRYHDEHDHDQVCSACDE